MSAPGGSGGPPGPEARVARLAAALRVAGGTAAVCISCHTAVTGLAGVLLTVFVPDGRRLIVSAVGEHGDRLEDLQLYLGQGPCQAAWAARVPVLVPDLTGDAATARWPRFAPPAVASGIRAIFAFPVLVGGAPQAVLDLYRATVGSLSPVEYRHAANHAAAAGLLLLDDARAASGQGQGAAVAGGVALVPQATGMVMAQLGVDARNALHHLRAYAHDEQRPVSDVAADLLHGRLRFPVASEEGPV